MSASDWAQFSGKSGGYGRTLDLLGLALAMVLAS